MVEKIKALWIKYEEIIAYLIVGGLTRSYPGQQNSWQTSCYLTTQCIPHPFRMLY